MKKIGYVTYIVVVLAGCFLLFATMFVKNEDIVNELNKETTSEGESLATSLDSYLSKNFGFRTEMISCYTGLQTGLFGTSPVEDVILGKNGYLFYEETVDDYCGTNLLGIREIYNINKTLELMQEYVKSQGGQMLLLVAPNKNSLYDYMPYNYQKTTTDSNWDRLVAVMDEVDYMDAFAFFAEKQEELYFKTDTHWNDLGAYYVYAKTMQQLGKSYEDRLAAGYEETCTMVGDLQRMLYPNAKANENQLVFAQKSDYVFLTNTRSFEQTYIETYKESAEGSLLMFRDSFANNLVDHYGNTYQYAIFDKASSYDLFQMDTYDADTVILEIAERNLELIQTSMPQFAAPSREVLTGTETTDLAEAYEQKASGDWCRISGYVQEAYVKADSCIYVRIDDMMYELMPQTVDGSAYGFCGYVPAFAEDAVVELIVTCGDDVFTEIVKMENE